MQRLYDFLPRIAASDASVLVLGETGTGKDLVAQAIHSMSRRAKEAFVPVNCGAVSPTLIESELFGHERGSFTGADRSHRGFFERANRGTLFLDEITEMPPELQVKLLRVLETGTLNRVGGTDMIHVDVRVIAATNRRPDEAIAAGKLREDLLYRLNVLPVELPPLRERRDDIELLAEHFIDELNKESGTAKRFTAAALQRLRTHSWPGNVRELRNVIHRAYIIAENDIGVDALPLGVIEDAPGVERPDAEGGHLDRRGGAAPDPGDARALRGRQEAHGLDAADQPQDALQPPERLPRGRLSRRLLRAARAARGIRLAEHDLHPVSGAVVHQRDAPRVDQASVVERARDAAAAARGVRRPRCGRSSRPRATRPRSPATRTGCRGSPRASCRDA